MSAATGDQESAPQPNAGRTDASADMTDTNPHGDNDQAPATQQGKTIPLRVRIFRKMLLVVLVIATLCLAWWQWTRYQSSSGTFQNLGYALQWPAFGAFFVYAFHQFDKYEKEMAETGISPTERKRKEEEAKGNFHQIDEDFLPERPHLDIDTYNKLNAPKRRRPRTNDSPDGNADNADSPGTATG